MRRTMGSLLVAHGLAHAAVGMWAAALGPDWLVTPLWVLAMTGLLAGGFGLAGVYGMRRWWEHLAIGGTIASLLLLLLFGRSVLLVGMVLDVAFLVAGLRAGESNLVSGFLGRRVPWPERAHPSRTAWGWVGTSLAFLLVAWTATTIIARPWHMQWGVADSELLDPLPGDGEVPSAYYRIDHAITVNAPADAVWPWLVQIGQDRAGFYSYDRLERLAGAHIRNVDRIVPAWQQRGAGDFVPAVQRGYLGGVLGDSVGWRVREVVPGRAMVLEHWGAFVVEPVDASHSRLRVRTRGDGRPSLQAVLLGPAGLLAFEPAHFIMEREMLRGIKRRAETDRAAAE